VILLMNKLHLGRMNSICLNRVLQSKYSNVEGPIIYVCPANSLEEYRWTSLLTKEPETIEWLSKIPNDSHLLDVGANIGCYTFSALAFGINKVTSIEPYPLNYTRIIDTCKQNSLRDIIPLCLGISTVPNLLTFTSESEMSGSAEFKQLPYASDCGHSVILIDPKTLPDQLLADITHIKIDVDGPECDVLHALLRSVKISSISSILVEVQVGMTDMQVIKIMSTIDFHVDKYYEVFTPHSSQRRALEDGNTARNIVFVPGKS